MQRHSLRYEPNTSLVWPAPPVVHVFNDNTDKISTIVPPEWTNVTRHYYESVIRDPPEITFYVTCFEIPPQALAQHGHAVLDVIATWMYSSANPLGKPDKISITPIILSRFPARECLGVRPDATTPIVEKLFLIGTHALLIGVDTTIDGIADPRVQEFLMSLQID